MTFSLTAIVIEQLVGAAFGTTFDRIRRSMGDRRLTRAIDDAVAKAGEHFVQQYAQRDPVLVDALLNQGQLQRPSVRRAVRAVVERPFDNHSASVELLGRTFQDVLPTEPDRARVDAAVFAFLRLLGDQILHIPEFQPLYNIYFQRKTAEQTTRIAESTAIVADHIALLSDSARAQGLLLGGTSQPLLTGANASGRRPRVKLPQRPYAQFVGRQEELAELRRLLLPHPRSRTYLATINGIGGVGKSALALELAYSYAEDYETLPPQERFEVILWISAKQTLLTPDGILHNRSTFNNLDDLFREIALVMKQPELIQGSPEQRRSQIEHALHDQRTLLLIDNLETVDDEELLSFLREMPDPTKAVITTRHRIDVARDIRLLGMPRPDADLLIANELAESGLTLSASQCDELYQRTGGVPLAIVWSIGTLRHGLSVDAMLRRLGSGQSDIARFCFTESSRLIAGRPSESLLLALSLFDADVGVPLLGAIAGLANDPYARDEGVAELLKLSLVNIHDGRLDLLPLTRSFARDQLQTRTAREGELRQRWIEQLTALARPYSAIHYEQPSPDALLSDGEHLLSLIRWAEQQQRPDLVMAVAPAALYYLDTIGDWGALQILAKQCLNYATLLRLEHEKVQLLYSLAWVQSQQGDREAAAATLAIALDQAQRYSDLSWQIEVLTRQVGNSRCLGDLASAEAQISAAERLTTQLSRTARASAQAELTYERGKIARDRGDWESARQLFEQALTVFSVDEVQPRFNPERSWGILGNLGYTLHRQGRLDEADSIYQRCLSFFRQSGGRGYLATLLVRRAELLLERGDRSAARTHAEESLILSERIGLIEEQHQARGVLAQLDAIAGTP